MSGAWQARFIFVLLFTAIPASAADMLVVFGTHLDGVGKGFSIAHFDSDTGKLTPLQFALETPGPAYFVIHPDGHHLYSCNTFPGQTPGKVSAYSIDAATGKIALINTVPSGGADPSYLSLDAAGKHALVANYQSGTIAVLAINPDGSLGKQTAFVQDTGRGVDPVRQTHPYAHSIRLDPTGRFAIAADLGLDKVFVYRYDADVGTLTPNDPPFVTVKPGSGARHSIFHPNGKWMYLITEMGSTIFQFNWDSDKGTLSQAQAISSLPPDFHGTSAAAEIAIHPNGKFLYASNRGSDTLGVFSIDPETGNLSFLEAIPTQGKTPRNFAFDPTGRWIIVTNHGSNNGTVFQVDAQTGHLTPTGPPFSVAYPFCERFLQVP